MSGLISARSSKRPFKFTGTIASITVELKDAKAAQQEKSQQARRVSRVKKALSD